jgi:hypothetical protein
MLLKVDTDTELFLIETALYDLLEKKQEALSVVKTAGFTHLTEVDFSIPTIEALISRMEAM